MNLLRTYKKYRSNREAERSKLKETKKQKHQIKESYSSGVNFFNNNSLLKKQNISQNNPNEPS